MAERARSVEDVGVNAAAWAGRRVLVTGCTGFKGSWLTLLLRELGAEVTGFALDPPTRPSLWESARAGDGVEWVRGDTADTAALESLVRRTDPHTVFHLAAQALVRESYREPLETFRVNVQGTAALLDALRRAPGPRAVVVVTSDKCYENREWDRGYAETDALGGRDPYAASKACAEIVAASYRASFFPPDEIGRHGVALATARAGNVIGGGDWAADRIVPDFVAAIAAGRPVRVRNPGAHRPWQHVLDALAGYVVLAERLADDPAAHAEAWNFGPSGEDVRTVGTLADDLCRLWGPVARWERDAAPQPHEARRLSLDASKARARLPLPPALDYAAALAWTVEWYRAWQDGADVRAETLAQIRRHPALAGRIRP